MLCGFCLVPVQLILVISSTVPVLQPISTGTTAETLNQRRAGEVNSSEESRNYLVFFNCKVNLIWSSHNDQITLDLVELYQPFGEGKALFYALRLSGPTALHNFGMVCTEHKGCDLPPLSDRAVLQSLCPRQPAQLRGMRGAALWSTLVQLQGQGREVWLNYLVLSGII